MNSGGTPAQPLRVLHLHSGNMMGGIESLLLTVAKCRSLTPEIEPAFALTFDGEFAARVRKLNAKVHLLPQVRLRHLPSLVRSRTQLRALFSEEQFDVVITHSPWTQSIFAGVVRKAQIPLVFWMHGPFDGHWLQMLASFHPPDFAICNSRWTQSTLERCYPRVANAVIYGPVEASSCHMSREETRAALGAGPDEVIVLIAARMEAWKGHSDLLRALARVRCSAPWRLLIAGAPNTAAESAYFNSLQTEAATLGIAARAQFLGHRSDVPALLAASDIYCQPNREPEPFGVVYVEALHRGVPVVTSRLGGAQEILDESTGILVAPGDSGALVQALTELIDHRELRMRLRTAGPARAQVLCDPARQMQMLNETLQSVVDRLRRNSGQ